MYVVPAPATETYELTVLGDLHGCYSCLKAALMQAQFFEKVNAYVNDPANNPNPKLVLLGDYVDRGLLSYEGVLRGVMQVFTAAPNHVYMLRGNHEFYLEYKGDIYGGVKPSEAINSLKPYIPTEMFKRYLSLFDSLPNMAIIDRTLFVHAGIPRDSLLRERWRGLSTLNDPDLRFQMMWSDPSQADIYRRNCNSNRRGSRSGGCNASRFCSGLAVTRWSAGTKSSTKGFGASTTTKTNS